jgi:hypothetical protein
MFVATATWGSIPSCIITGTVISDVPPVTTLMKAVKINTPTSQISIIIFKTNSTYDTLLQLTAEPDHIEPKRRWH